MNINFLEQFLVKLWIIILLLFISTGSLTSIAATNDKDQTYNVFEEDFIPTKLTGSVLWLDASDINGDAVPGGSYGNIQKWIDKSVESNADALQDSSSFLPSIVQNGLNGLNTISFSDRQYFDVDQTSFSMLRNVSGSTLFSVIKPTAQWNGQRVLMIATSESQKTRAGLSLFDSPSYDESGSFLGGNGDFGITGRVQDDDIFQRIEGGSATIGLFQQYTGVIDYVNGIMELYVDRNFETKTELLHNPGKTSDTDSLNIRIGADANLNSITGTFFGEIAELIVYNRALNTDERESVEDYLLNKWKYNESTLVETTSDVNTSSLTNDSNTNSTPFISVFQISSIIMVGVVYAIYKSKKNKIEQFN